MSFKYVENSHQVYPEDEYIKESLYILFDDKYRVLYVRKKSSKGGMFWSVASAGFKLQGEKIYLDSFESDSKFLEKDVKNFLESRAWDSNKVLSVSEDLPF